MPVLYHPLHAETNRKLLMSFCDKEARFPYEINPAVVPSLFLQNRPAARLEVQPVFCFASCIWCILTEVFDT
jgi:hypothetical protein